jgi:hypothetical protein
MTAIRFVWDSCHTSLYEPQSPFPGNGILPAETKAPEKCLRFECPLAETTRTHGSPLFRGNSQ